MGPSLFSRIPGCEGRGRLLDMAALERIYNCMSCRQQIKLERKQDGSGWLKWNLDGTKHVDFNNKNSSLSTATTTKVQQRQNNNNNNQPPTNHQDNPNKVLIAETQIATLAELIAILTRKIDDMAIEIKQLKQFKKVDENPDKKSLGDED
jgi:hypothetical protein